VFHSNVIPQIRENVRSGKLSSIQYKIRIYIPDNETWFQRESIHEQDFETFIWYNPVQNSLMMHTDGLENDQEVGAMIDSEQVLSLQNIGIEEQFGITDKPVRIAVKVIINFEKLIPPMNIMQVFLPETQYNSSWYVRDLET
jgi:hypothetical protein